MRSLLRLIGLGFIGCALGANIPPLTWGPAGHSLVAAIAQTLLNDSATAAVLNLLPESNGNMAAVASWADQMRHTYPWSAELHYINTPDWACTYEYDRDCQYKGVPNICVDGAIQNYTARLLDTSLPFDQQNEALKFLIHFVGDIHQPLHCGFTTDEGGNTFKGHFNGKEENLHEIWDSAILAERIDNDFNKNQTDYLTYLVQQINTVWMGQANGWEVCNTTTPDFDCSTQWAVESINLACRYSYVEANGKTHIKTGFTLGDPYYERNMPIIEFQIAKGGVRLAQVLNAIFPSS